MKTSIINLAVAVSLMASGAFAAVHAQEPAQQSKKSDQSSLVSAEVKSDLADWRAAGFDAQSADALSYDVFGAECQRRYAKYIELRKLHTQQAAHN